ncbi:type VII secretion-associated serine protease mycosin [Actinoplanes tereljensis]|uniref:Peptidase S8/S53 domain-containing protein n=1 Tax=Paractinoplanes tereljensis TaxID=571912 RepID=A0A919NFP5_9ACTN|nr:S8 family peptidase [Actinoplanes tereljensis]GIF17761.1 hypothetical protein Ate02nite_04910 [Actinoplanes tereljensis]
MAKRMLRYGVGALAIGTLAGAAVLPVGSAQEPAARALRPAAPSPAPTAGAAARNLRVAPEKLVPRKVSAARPARIVTTTVGRDGRPVISVHTATDSANAVALVRRAQRTEGAAGVELDVPVVAAEAPGGSDPYRFYQWDLDTVRAPAAWARTTGAGVTVAVLDSGVDAGHPDLAGQVLPGADLTDGTEGPSHDVHGHGTHVAGTIAAATGNGTGVAGIAPDVKILPVRVLGDTGAGYMSVAAQGVIWAADHGADVINLSISGATEEQSMTYAIAYARSRNVVVVAAAGNDRQKGNPVSFPGASPGVIAVAATGQGDAVAPFSTAGAYVDIAAPGAGIVSTYPGNRYVGMNGTSMATPHIAAAAALLRSVDRTLNPDQIEAALESSAVDLGAPGRDDDYGHGRLDIVAALDKATTPEPAPADPTPTEPTPTPTQTEEPEQDVIDAGETERQAEFGESTTTSFTVTSAADPVAGREVDVCLSVDDADFTCTREVTAADGTVTRDQPATAPFRVRLAIPGTETTATVSYRVRAHVTLSADGHGAITVSIDGLDGQRAVLQSSDGTYWSTVGTFPAASQVRIGGLTPDTRYRVVLPMTRRFVGVISETVQLGVISETVQLSPATPIPGQ